MASSSHQALSAVQNVAGMAAARVNMIIALLLTTEAVVSHLPDDDAAPAPSSSTRLVSLWPDLRPFLLPSRLGAAHACRAPAWPSPRQRCQSSRRPSASDPAVSP